MVEGVSGSAGHPEPGAAATGRPRLLPQPGGLPSSRRWAGLSLVAIGLPALTGILVPLRDTVSLESVLLLYLLAVVLVSVTGGWLPALVAAFAAVLLANFFFTRPYHTLVVESRDSVIALIVFVGVAVTVSLTVDLAARRRVAGERSRIEAEALSRIATAPVDDTSLTATLEEVRSTFGMTSVALVARSDVGDQVVAHVGSPPRGRPAVSADAGGGLRLIAEGPDLFAEDRRVLRRLAATAARAWEGQQLAGEAAHARRLAEVDRLRAALLAAVGHDLRTPLASVKAAVSGLRQQDVTLPAEEQDELLATIEESADRLDSIISNLLAMSRLQAGVLSVALQPVALDEVVARAVLGAHAQDVTVQVPDDLPLALADAGLLERVVANLVTNAGRFSPAGSTVRVEADHSPDQPDRIRLRVIDAGPGVAKVDWERMFAPFERLDDRATEGAGLGLAIARGFSEAMSATLTPSDTPGGGLTMTLMLPVATP